MGDSFAALPIAFREGQRIVRGMKDVVRLLLIPFVEPPTEWWVAGDLMSGDWRPTLLAIGLLGLYAVVMAVPPLRDFFELALLRGWDYLALAAIAVAWALVQRILWRTQLFERLLSP
jgi:cation-transporting ATPase E